MTKRPDMWMPLYIADYLSSTTRLSTEQHGAYLLILFDYWKSGPPPDSNSVLARIAGLSPRQWLFMRPVIQPFFTIEDGRWRNKRIDIEWEKTLSRVEANRINGSKGGRPTKKTGNPSVNPSLNPRGNPVHNPEKTPTHTHINQRPAAGVTTNGGDHA